MKICIILLNWNGKKDTLECLASLQKVTGPAFQTIVVDNGSTDDSVEALRIAYPDLPILEMGKNLGFAAGNNEGILFALRKKFEWILLLNNDTVVDPYFLQAFMQAVERHPAARILGAKIYRYGDPMRIDHLGGVWDSKRGEFSSCFCNQMEDGVSFEMEKEADYVCGAALLMHRSVPETIGLLEPRYFLFWEETDFCIRAKKSGFEIWTAPKAKVWHKVSSSFTGGKPHMHYFWWRSRLLWIERNCTKKQAWDLYRRFVLPDAMKMVRHFLLRQVQSLLFPKSKEREARLLRYQSGCAGIRDYVLRRFGNAPDWITVRKVDSAR